jgi:hypothetical protein
MCKKERNESEDETSECSCRCSWKWLICPMMMLLAAVGIYTLVKRAVERAMGEAGLEPRERFT